METPDVKINKDILYFEDLYNEGKYGNLIAYYFAFYKVPAKVKNFIKNKIKYGHWAEAADATIIQILEE